MGSNRVTGVCVGALRGARGAIDQTFNVRDEPLS